MKWKPGKRSGDIEDRRGEGGGLGGGGMPIPMGRLGGGGIGTLIVLAIVYFLFIQGGGGGGGFNVPDPTSSFPQVPQSGTGNDSVPGSPSEEKEVQFVDFVQGDAQDFWTQQFQGAGRPYQRAKVVLFRDQVRTEGCGLASSAVGPFYCPADQKVYIDLAFYDELAKRFKAPGEFAQAYVIAHEIGHHVQNLLGHQREGPQLQRQVGKPDANELSVMLELQADYSPASGPISTYDAASSRAATSSRA